MDSNKEFEYMGKGCVVPKDVIIVRFHPSVVEVENHAFMNCKQLRKVMFNDGLQKIGMCEFYACKLLSSIKLPSTVTQISSIYDSCRRLRGEYSRCYV